MTFGSTCLTGKELAILVLLVKLSFMFHIPSAKFS